MVCILDSAGEPQRPPRHLILMLVEVTTNTLHYTKYALAAHA